MVYRLEEKIKEEVSLRNNMWDLMEGWHEEYNLRDVSVFL